MKFRAIMLFLASISAIFLGYLVFTQKTDRRVPDGVTPSIAKMPYLENGLINFEQPEEDILKVVRSLSPKGEALYDYGKKPGDFNCPYLHSNAARRRYKKVLRYLAEQDLEHLPQLAYYAIAAGDLQLFTSMMKKIPPEALFSLKDGACFMDICEQIGTGTHREIMDQVIAYSLDEPGIQEHYQPPEPSCANWALSVAARNVDQSRDTVKYLIEKKGASVNANPYDTTSGNVFSSIVMSNQLDMVKYFVEKQLELDEVIIALRDNIEDFQNPGLGKNPEIFRYILEKTFNKDNCILATINLLAFEGDISASLLTNYSKRSGQWCGLPIQLKHEVSLATFVEKLIKKGALVNYKDKEGASALEHANRLSLELVDEGKFKAVAQVLKKHGAK